MYNMQITNHSGHNYKIGSNLLGLTTRLGINELKI